MNNSSEKIALGCDHAAYQLKEQVKAHLEAMGLELKDFGTFDESSVDYPDYAFFVGKAVVSGECSRGIVLCGTGIGISIAANKIPGELCFQPNVHNFQSQLRLQHAGAKGQHVGVVVLTAGLGRK